MTHQMVGDTVRIKSLKHCGSFHRSWAKTEVVHHTAEEFIGVNEKTLVTEADGTQWITQQAAVCFFWPDRWYNVIALEGENDWAFYCNIASPYVQKDGNQFVYIDYDIDYFVDQNGFGHLLDMDEFRLNSSEKGYPAYVMNAVENALLEIQRRHHEKEGVFAPGVVSAWLGLYRQFHS
ncbi:DUF402 domain-containing protein [Aureibacillus halotolerans]|uniref:DUF402 domain-containing protein n=1 Tax=Aureibacillus halotolerans TaxID=1508390 RepID=A0A4R6TU81_9BACI|nr:DUF402 domain-containing protein [Aureibacillus halotolerans]TDQ33743.1 hypothetical protein EV213_1299 [Aureibacillus halotolerans]